MSHYDWITSSCSTGGNCVEVAFPPGEVLVRHSKDPDGPQLRFTPEEWDVFVEGGKLGEFDL